MMLFVVVIAVHIDQHEGGGRESVYAINAGRIVASSLVVFDDDDV